VCIYIIVYVQDDSEGKVNILGGDSIGHCEEKVNKNTCLIPNGYPDTQLFESQDTAPLDFCGVG
jgi:hypothetical protein